MSERYVIRVRGVLGPLLRSLFGEHLTYKTVPRQSTLQGQLSAEELQELLALLDRSGVELIQVDRAP
ncbi:MAG: hypothetical protein ABW022_27990 [Actinoplanes sp.]